MTLALPKEPSKKGNVKTQGSRKKGFGTFGGVFTPSLLTILGVVMYLRFGWVVGAAGLGKTLVIVVVSHLISFATGLSVASIATNRTVGAGGAYFMISRSLGGPVGAAIGVPLFLGQAIGTAFYIIGFTESLAGMLPALASPFAQRLVSSAVCVLLTLLSLKSAEAVIKAQYFVMLLILASLVSFFTGTGPEPPEAMQWANPEARPFGELFGVFFPAVTGIMAGVSMSGDLADPRKSIPAGTLAAIATGMVVYLIFPFWLAMNATNQAMTEQLDIVWKIASVPILISVGVWAATISSALGSILTAPRTLQALATDGVAPKLFARGYGKSQEPAAGIVLTFGLAMAAIWLGDLDFIAPILTMFFLVTYGMTNLVCGLERWAASPSFRPDFKVPAWISLSGAIACFYVMSMLDMGAAVASLAICAMIYAYAQRKALGTTYGDARHGLWAALVRSALLRLRDAKYHAQNWRPNLLVLGGDPNRRAHLLRFGGAVVQERGLVTYAQFLVGSVYDQAEPRKQLLARVGQDMAQDYPTVFYRVDIVDDVYRGAVSLAQSYGLGSFETNTVMLGWTDKPERQDAYVRMLRDMVWLDRSLVLVRHTERFSKRKQPQIDVWWGGFKGNGGFMLLLAYLLTADESWRNATIRVLTAVDEEQDKREAERSITKVLASSRLTAQACVFLREDLSIPQLMRKQSAEADLVIMGFRIPEPDEPVEPFFDRMRAMLEQLPTTLLVHRARTFEGEPLLFDPQRRSLPPSMSPTLSPPSQHPSQVPPQVDIPASPAVPKLSDQAE